MTKVEELRLLRKVIKQFGPDSYIGPWLKANHASIEWAIVNDWPLGSIFVTDRPKET